MDTILDHPYSDPTQVAEFNAVAELIGCKTLHYEKAKTEDNGEPLEGVVIDNTDPPPKTEPSFDVRDIFNNVFTSVFSLMPHWAVTVKEVGMLSDAWGGAVDYWFPSINENLTPASNAYLTTGIVLLPRLLSASEPKQAQQGQRQPTQATQQATTEQQEPQSQTFGGLKNG